MSIDSMATDHPHLLSHQPICCSSLSLSLMAEALAILDDVELLRDLAKMIYYQEAEAINDLPFDSGEDDMDEYLHGSTDNYDSILNLLDSGVELKRKFEKEPVKSPIANDIFSYIVYCANSALQTVRNYTVRIDYLKKIGEHVKHLTTALDELDPGKETDVKNLADEALQYKEAMLEFLNKYRSTDTASYSQNLMEEGKSFDELVQWNMEIIGLYGAFKYLNDIDKIGVYNMMIKSSGLERLADLIKKLVGPAGIACVLITAGLMVWDIFSSAHVFQTATHDVVVSLASAGGAWLGNVVAAAVLEESAFDVVIGETFVAMAVVGTGILGAIAVGALAGALVGLIISSGGSEPIDTEGQYCYVTTMLPDGVVLARQIEHDHKYPPN